MTTIKNSIRQKLINSFAGRTMLQSFGWLETENKIEPYFAFRIGKYQADHYLYFPKEPLGKQYHNFVFNRICLEFENAGIGNFLDAHFNEYDNKTEFLKYLSWLTDFKKQVRPNLSAISFCKNWNKEKTVELAYALKKIDPEPIKENKIDLSPVEEKVDELIEALPEKFDPVEKKLADLMNDIEHYKNGTPAELEPLKSKVSELVTIVEAYQKTLPGRMNKIDRKLNGIVINLDKFGASISDKFEPVENKVADLMNGIDKYKNSLPEKLFPKIKLSNPEDHAEKLIHLYFMLSNITINAKPVFKMNDSDIKQLLPLIYADFDAPYNTVKKKVENAKSDFADCSDQNVYKALQDSLEKFFT